MEETALLTDDEIVALCAVDGRPWPIGLPTVTASAEELAVAGMRGMRSLMVRRLAGGNADRTGVRPHQLIARDVAAFLDAAERIGAYIAPATDHDTLGGAAVTAARTPDGWIVDTATAAGVHALRLAGPEEAASAIVGLADNAYRGELFTDPSESEEWVCMVKYGPAQVNTLAVGAGSVAGSVDGRAVTSWDPELIRGLFDRR